METKESKVRRLAEYNATADELLKKGDGLMKTKPSEGRRTLRECRRYRMKAKKLREELASL